LSDTRTLGCIKGYFHPLCVASFGKSDSGGAPKTLVELHGAVEIG